MLIWDKETGPEPKDVIRERMPPYKPDPPPGPFDPYAVKLGNLKDEAKKATKVEAARLTHAKAVAGYEADVKAGETGYWAKIIDRAALSPVTGRILAIGYLSTDCKQQLLDHGRPEREMLVAFWEIMKEPIAKSILCVGHNIFGFDIVFAVQRSFMLSVEVPEMMRDPYAYRRYFADTMRIWTQGAKGKDAFIKLDVLAKLLGVGAKPDDMDGGMFAEVYQTDQEKALAYLANDLDMTRAVAERMGLL